MSADMSEHRAVSTRQMPGALRPAQVTPYCPRCNVPWPCPTGAARQPTALDGDAQSPPGVADDPSGAG